MREIKRTRVNRGGFAFYGDCLYPFLGEHTGKRLKNIPLEYWKKFVDEKDFNTEGLAPHQKGGKYNTVLGKLLAYAKREIRKSETKEVIKDKDGKLVNKAVLKGRFCINNGTINKWIHLGTEIPEGFVKGQKKVCNPMSEAQKASISKGVRKFFKTKAGRDLKAEIGRRNIEINAADKMLKARGLK